MKTILSCSSPPNNFYRSLLFPSSPSHPGTTLVLLCRNYPTLKHPGDAPWLQIDGAISRGLEKKHWTETTGTTVFKKTEASLKHPVWGTWLVIKVNQKQQSGIRLPRNWFCIDAEEAGTWETAPKQVQAVGPAFLEVTCQKAILTVSTHIIYVLNLIWCSPIHFILEYVYLHDAKAQPHASNTGTPSRIPQRTALQ